MSQNEIPSTPFGIWFAKHGIGKHRHYYGIIDTWESLSDEAKIAIKSASAWIAVINENVEASPKFVFTALQIISPQLSDEAITEGLARITRGLQLVGKNIPVTKEDAIEKLQAYLGKFTDKKPWIAITKSVVGLLAGALAGDGLDMEQIFQVMEYVYRTFVKKSV